MVLKRLKMDVLLSHICGDFLFEQEQNIDNHFTLSQSAVTVDEKNISCFNENIHFLNSGKDFYVALHQNLHIETFSFRWVLLVWNF